MDTLSFRQACTDRIHKYAQFFFREIDPAARFRRTSAALSLRRFSRIAVSSKGAFPIVVAAIADERRFCHCRAFTLLIIIANIMALSNDATLAQSLIAVEVTDTFSLA
jgi:hypothetical protein